MNLLLTSCGLTNQTIVSALREMAHKPFAESVLVFIPTAANTLHEDKSWLETNYDECRALGCKEMDIVDIDVMARAQWEPRVRRADILVVGGGDTWHLLKTMRESGFSEVLPDLLHHCVYVGISAGSMVTERRLYLQKAAKLYYEERPPQETADGLGLVDFHVLPHLNSKDFPEVRMENIEALFNDVNEPIYILDDQSAVKVMDGKIEIVSEGEWKLKTA